MIERSLLHFALFCGDHHSFRTPTLLIGYEEDAGTCNHVEAGLLDLHQVISETVNVKHLAYKSRGLPPKSYT